MLAREKNIVWNVKTESGILRILCILFTGREREIGQPVVRERGQRLKYRRSGLPTLP
jgi:hypothetical protein